VAHATPDQLRTYGTVPAIRLPLAGGAPIGDLPPGLAAHADPERGELLIRGADVTADLESLIGWARRNRLDLTGLEVGPPSLEEAYLALTGDTAPPRVLKEAASHA
jgi:ABC-2 type transport system ATP-binding protein